MRTTIQRYPTVAALITVTITITVTVTVIPVTVPAAPAAMLGRHCKRNRGHRNRFTKHAAQAASRPAETYTAGNAAGDPAGSPKER